MVDDMDTNNNSITEEKSNNVSGTQPIFAKPFLDISKVEDTSKECVARARKLSAKALKLYEENLDHNNKVNFKNSHPNTFDPTF